MKEKTLYYRIIVREVNRMINDGFLIVTIYDGELLSLEGVLAEDYLTAKIDDNAISIEYYSRHEVFGEYEKNGKLLYRRSTLNCLYILRLTYQTNRIT